MKFYYNGKLIRTSKTHEYKYAIIRKDDIKRNAPKITPFACSKDMKGIESNLSYLSKDLRLYKSVKNGTYKPRRKYGCPAKTAKEIEQFCIKWYGSLDAAIEAEQRNFDQWTVIELESK